MAWSKNVNLNADITNENLSAQFHFIKTGTDGYGGDIKDLAMTLRIELDDGSYDISRVIVQDVLNAQQKSDLNALLVILRDAALTAKGYSQT